MSFLNKYYLADIARNAANWKGWRTRRKIVVIESDDWGTVRMPSQKVWQALDNKFPNAYHSAFNRLDCLESSDDLNSLFEALQSVKDQTGRHAVMTANTVVANPDFEKISDSKFTSYFYEPFVETYKRYYKENVKEHWRQGMEQGLFFPQFHCREHVDHTSWLKYLRQGNDVLTEAFSYGVFCADFDLAKSKKNLMAALDHDTDDELQEKQNAVGDGLKLFYSLFNFQSHSFIAPSYTWHPDIEKTLSQNHVTFIQGIKNQKVPTTNERSYYFKTHFLGEQNKWNQHYLVRNIFFEPAVRPSSSIVAESLARVRAAFNFHRPAIISTHRLNFIGGIIASNRKANTALFAQLLNEIVRQHPTVEFMNTVELGNVIAKSKSKL